MIRYSLICEKEHAFESWFPSSAAFDEQARRGLVSCPFCESLKVGKAIMAPNVARSGRTASAMPNAHNSNEKSDVSAEYATQKHEVALVDERLRALHAMVRDLRAKIVESTTDVGAAFPEEARKMHAGETAERPIRGEASVEDARALLEEGIEIMPIPFVPEDRN